MLELNVPFHFFIRKHIRIKLSRSHQQDLIAEKDYVFFAKHSEKFFPLCPKSWKYIMHPSLAGMNVCKQG